MRQWRISNELSWIKRAVLQPLTSQVVYFAHTSVSEACWVSFLEMRHSTACLRCCCRQRRPAASPSHAFLLPHALQALVQHAVRLAMAADAQTLQFKLPPPGVPLPPTHMSPGVASGAPVVEALAVTSLWTVQLLKLLAQVSGWCAAACSGMVGALHAWCG